MLNYRLSQEFKLIENNKLNYVINQHNPTITGSCHHHDLIGSPNPNNFFSFNFFFLPFLII
jgi:hypothetical protein